MLEKQGGRDGFARRHGLQKEGLFSEPVEDATDERFVGTPVAQPAPFGRVSRDEPVDIGGSRSAPDLGGLASAFLSWLRQFPRSRCRSSTSGADRSSHAVAYGAVIGRLPRGVSTREASSGDRSGIQNRSVRDQRGNSARIARAISSSSAAGSWMTGPRTMRTRRSPAGSVRSTTCSAATGSPSRRTIARRIPLRETAAIASP